MIQELDLERLAGRVDAGVVPLLIASVIPDPVSGAWQSNAFTMMSHVGLRTDSWSASILVSSQRTALYEYGNDENRRGWHTASGWPDRDHRDLLIRPLSYAGCAHAVLGQVAQDSRRGHR